MRFIFFLLVNLTVHILHAQSEHRLLLKVLDEGGFALSNVLVELDGERYGITNDRGELIVVISCGTSRTISLSKAGYMSTEQVLDCSAPDIMMIEMKRVMSLQEVVVVCDNTEQYSRNTSLHVERYNREVLREFGRSNVVQTLSRMAGVWSYDRGMGQSKPLIRGLGFQRIVIIEDDMRQEGPHWMVEHALHLDEHAIEHVEVVRGPSAFLYGSDALGGAIIIDYYPELPEGMVSSAELSVGGMSGTMGGDVAGRYVKKFKNVVAGTYISGQINGDYAVLADSVDVYSYRIPLYRRFMRNTASNNMNATVFIGYHDSLSEYRSVFRVYQSKSGFFANAHGLEPQQIDYQAYDRNRYDVMMPYHKYTGLIAQVNGKKGISERILFRWLAGMQQYELTEFSRYVSHGYMPPVFPDTLHMDPQLEFFWGMQAYTGQLSVLFQQNLLTSLRAGITTSFKRTTIDGRSFLLPSHQKSSGGVFLIVDKRYRQYLFEAGVRYDGQQIDVKPYRDWFQSVIIDGRDTVWQYVERAKAQRRWYNGLGWGMGIVYPVYGDRYWKVHVGKGYRFPDVMEFASNGTNYHWFRYEKGNMNLQTENIYEVSILRALHSRRWANQFSGFISYAPSFIYLQPTSQFDIYYGQGLQIYQYTQTSVFRAGFELHQHFHISKHHLAGLAAEYVYSEQCEGTHKGYPISFTPPATLMFHYKFHSWYKKFFEQSLLFFDLVYMLPQHRVVPPEEITASAILLHTGVGLKKMHTSGSSVNMSIFIENLLNQKYQLHLSYYRLLNLPEPGRSVRFQILWSITNKNIKED